MCCLAQGPTAQAQVAAERTPAAAMMPAQVDLYVELHDPAQVAALLPLALIGPEGQRLMQNLGLLAGATVCLGIDTQSEQAMLVIDSPDAQRLQPLATEAIRVLSDLASQLRASQPDNGGDLPVPADAKPPELAPGDPVRRFGRLAVTRLEGKLIVATEPAWLEQSLAAMAVPARGAAAVEPAPANPPTQSPPAQNLAVQSLAADTAFCAARDAVRVDAPAWLFVRPSALAKLLVGDGPLLRAGQKFPIVKQLLGGILLPASKAPYLAFELGQREGQLELSLVLPEEMRDADGDLRLLVAALDNNAKAYAPLLPQGTILSISAAVSHDAVALLHKLLLDPERLKQQAETNPEVAALLEGLPLIEQILARVEPQMQLIVVQQPAAASERAQADLRLPAAALLFRPHDAAKVKTAFITTYLGTIRNANVRAKAAGRPTMTLKSERRGEALVTGAVYPQRENDPLPGRLEYNLSPSMAVIGDTYLVSTNYELAQELADLAQKGPPALELTNLRVDVGAAALIGTLAENLPALMQGQTATATADSATPLVDLATNVLRRLMERQPDEPRELSGPASRIPWRVRMRARFGRL